MSVHAQLIDLAKRLQQATDSEDWGQAEQRLGQINQLLASQGHTLDRASLETIQASVLSALQDTERRRNEIGVLLRGLSGKPNPADEAA